MSPLSVKYNQSLATNMSGGGSW